jgi:[ribosomal protein S18]-alanine N-acetyltransferase
LSIPAKLRHAHTGDAAEVSALDKTIFGAAAYSDSSWVAELQNASGLVILAESNGTNIAFICASCAGDETEIRKIGVLAEHRRLGIAKELIQHALQHFKSKRCLIDVSVANGAGVEFYQKLGFREIIRRKKYYADGSDAIVMELLK